MTPPDLKAHAKPVSAPKLIERPSLAACIGAMKPVQRLATPFDGVNAITRGGIPMRSLTVFGGEPGAGKTSAVMTIALDIAAQHHPVTWLAVDEEREDIYIRLGQAEGFGRDEMEAAHPSTLVAASERIGAAYPTLTILDGDDITVEEAAEELIARRQTDAPALLVLDSLQTVTTRAADGEADPRMKVDAVVRVARRIAKSGGIAVLAISEQNRGSYRSKNKGEQTRAIASFKESSGIEYRCKLALVMRKVEGFDGLREVEVPKNRIGRDDLPPIMLQLDRATALFRETSAPPGVAASLGFDSATQLEIDVEAVRDVLRKNPGVAGYDRLRAELIGMSGARRSAAVRALKTGGEIVNHGTTNQPRLSLNEGVLPGLTGLTVRPVSPPLTGLTAPIGRKALGKGSPGKGLDETASVRPQDDGEGRQ